VRGRAAVEQGRGASDSEPRRGERTLSVGPKRRIVGT
jgi:hypothetical protein